MTPLASSRRRRACTAETESPTFREMSPRVARPSRETSRMMPASTGSSTRAGGIASNGSSVLTRARLSAPNSLAGSIPALDRLCRKDSVESASHPFPDLRSEVSMSISHMHEGAVQAIVGEPEVVEDALRQTAGAAGVEASAAWHRLKDAATTLQTMQAQDGSVPDPADHAEARVCVEVIVTAIGELAPRFPHDADYLAASRDDFERWADGGFGVPDFLDSLVAFQPQQHRIDGIRHLVVFPMYTQNGSSNRLVEALIVETIWPEFIAALEAGDYGNKLFVSLRLVDFTPGYDTNSAVLFPETVAMREIPAFTWGAIFQDREAARYRRVVRAA